MVHHDCFVCRSFSTPNRSAVRFLPSIRARKRHGGRHACRRNSPGDFRLLSPQRARRIHLRPPRGERRQAGQPSPGRRPHHHRDARPHPHLHRHRAARRGLGTHGGDRYRAPAHDPFLRAVSAASGQGEFRLRRSDPQFPLLRQPPEISPVRQYLQRETGGREPGDARTRQYPPASAGVAPVRRRRRRRLGAHARDACHARALSDDAVLYRRQGDQPRGHPAYAREDAGPLLRAPGERAWC